MDTRNWMGGIDGNKKLSELTIPGTHDTGTWPLFTGPAKCQKDSLEEQLNNGIRFIDIRLKPSGYTEGLIKYNDGLVVWHGQSNTGLTFKDIIKTCQDFLGSHSNETIIMSVKNESKYEPRDEVFSFAAELMIKAYGDLFHTGTSIPKLGDVRGKIVLMRRYPPAGRPAIGIDLNSYWPNHGKPKIASWENGEDLFYVQDQYDDIMIENKFDGYVKPTLDLALNPSNMPLFFGNPAPGNKICQFINFASCTGRLWPVHIADMVNPKILNHLNSSGRYGIIAMDVPDPDLIKKLIGTNLMPFMDRVFEKETVFPNETNGIWTMAGHAKYPLTPFATRPYLTFIKTANTESGKVEVHIASGMTDYQTCVLNAPSTFDLENNGTWLVAYNTLHPNIPGFPGVSDFPDLVYIKTANADSGKVEVHIASGSSQYQERILSTPTAFGLENNGTWLMADYDRDGIQDLVYIKTSGTESRKVEVHIASGKSGYKDRILSTPTTFDPENDGVWTMADWDGDGIPDLIYIKTSNTPSGNVEVHIASGASEYKTRIMECATTFVNENNGAWGMQSFQGSGTPDLIYIKTANTPSGHVEVHVASGKK